MKETIQKLGFGDKTKGHYSVRSINYSMLEFDNGTVAMTGFPEYTLTYQTPKSNWSKTYSGPIVIILIHDTKAKFVTIPRKQEASEGSGNIPMISKDKLICIYNDNEKNIQNEISDKVKEEDSPKNLALAAAIIDEGGNIISRKKIADNAIGKNYFFTSYTKELSNNTFLIPIGRTKANFVKYVTDIVQWATIEVK
jgi:hypothetical protein